jgi:hypothetical protein
MAGREVRRRMEGLDDDHAAAATGAWTREHRRLGSVSRFGIARDRVRLRNVLQRARFGDVDGAATVGQEPVVADAMEAFRQNVHQEAANELVCRECHELVALGTFDLWSLYFERDAIASAAIRRRSEMATRCV